MNYWMDVLARALAGRVSRHEFFLKLGRTGLGLGALLGLQTGGPMVQRAWARPNPCSLSSEGDVEVCAVQGASCGANGGGTCCTVFFGHSRSKCACLHLKAGELCPGQS